MTVAERVDHKLCPPESHTRTDTEDGRLVFECSHTGETTEAERCREVNLTTGKRCPHSVWDGVGYSRTHRPVVTITFATVGPGIARGTLRCPHGVFIVESANLSLALHTAALIDKHVEAGDALPCLAGLWDRTVLPPEEPIHAPLH